MKYWPSFQDFYTVTFLLYLSVTCLDR